MSGHGHKHSLLKILIDAHGITRKELRSKSRHMPKRAEPRSLEREYLKDILPGIRVAHAAVEQHLIPMLPSLYQQSGVTIRQAKTDTYSDTLNQIMRQLQQQLKTRGPTTKQLQDLTTLFGHKIDAFDAANMNRQLKGVLGIDVFTAVPDLAGRVHDFSYLNTRLIESIPEQYLDQLHDTVMRSVSAGIRPEELTKDLQDRYDIGERRAALIARDQVGKFNGQLNGARQESLGITAYFWRTSLDEKVREEHALREGERFEWSDPPEDGNPGEPIQCRCTADPDMDDLF